MPVERSLTVDRQSEKKKKKTREGGREKKKTANFHRNKCRQVKRRPNVTDQKVSPVLFSFHSRIARRWNFISTRWPDASLKPTDISRRYNRTIYISIKRVSPFEEKRDRNGMKARRGLYKMCSFPARWMF